MGRCLLSARAAGAQSMCSRFDDDEASSCGATTLSVMNRTPSIKEGRGSYEEGNNTRATGENATPGRERGSVSGYTPPHPRFFALSSVFKKQLGAKSADVVITF